MIYLVFLGLFYVILLIYFKIAKHFNIVDIPNSRSSHSKITIRGGGIIYLVAALASVLLHPNNIIPVLSVFVIGVISFVDDRVSLSRRLRIFFHLLAVTILFYYLDLYSIAPLWAVVPLYIGVIGIINAYNFMDGINGISGTYSIVVLLGLQFINVTGTHFIEPDLISLPILASIVFLFFNFRKQARCFGGDVGSITVALWIVFLILTLIIKTGNYTYLLFLAVYGVDSVITIVHRIKLKQNIFEAHRFHLYQLLANDKKMSHLSISLIYGIVQLLISAVVIFSSFNQVSVFLLTLIPLTAIYLVVRLNFDKL